MSKRELKAVEPTALNGADATSAVGRPLNNAPHTLKSSVQKDALAQTIPVVTDVGASGVFSQLACSLCLAASL